MVTMGLYDYSVTSSPFFYFEMLKMRNLQVSSFEKFSGGGGVVCLIIVSTPGPGFVVIKSSSKKVYI